MKKRVSIYIDEAAWENLKDHAWQARKSASAYLEDLISGEIPLKNQATIVELATVIEDVKLDVLEEISQEEENLLRAAQDRAKEKISKLENIRASRPYFNPQPKKGINGKGK